MQRLSFSHIPEYRASNFRCFEPGERHVTRVWHEHVLIFMTDGTLNFTEDGRSVSVCKNHYYIQKANTRQSAERESDSPRYFYIHFDGCIEETEVGLPLEGKFDSQHILPILEEMDKICKDPSKTKFEKSYIFYHLLSVLDASQKKPVSQKRALAEKIHEIILEQYRAPFSIEELSRRLSYSKNHLIDVFKKTYGTTPYKYVINLRLEYARQLLITTDKSCQSVSDECGFAEYTLFYKLFCTRFGSSPTKYRENPRL